MLDASFSEEKIRRCLQCFKLAVSKKVLIATAVVIGGIAAAASEHPSEFFCKEENRFLSDAEFLEIAFSYELSRSELSEPHASLGIQGIRKIDPDCCYVLRENNPWMKDWRWIDRLLSPAVIYVSIEWDLDPDSHKLNISRFGISTCGKVLDRGGIFIDRPKR